MSKKKCNNNKKKICKKSKKECKKKKKLSAKDLKNRLSFYKAMYNVPKNHRCDLIKYLNDEGTNYLCEAIYNTIHVDLGLKGKKKQKLINELKTCGSKINHICQKTIDINKRKKYLSQKGGFLGTLLSVVIPTVASLITSAIKRKNA